MNEVTPKEAVPTSSQVGLAIASLSVGVLVSISAIPAGILLAEESGPALLSLVAFACISFVMGFIGRRNAMGVAGLTLACIAVVETLSVYGYISYQAKMERLKEIAVQKEKTAQDRERAVLAEAQRKTVDAERRLKEIQFEHEKKKLEAETAEANAKRAKLESEERIRMDTFREQESIKLAAQTKALEDERVMQDRKSVEEQEATKKHAIAVRKREDKAMIGKMVILYQPLMDEYKTVCVKVNEMRLQKEKMEKEYKIIELRISHATSRLNKLIQEGDGPQRKQIESEIHRLYSLLNKYESGQQDIPTTLEYDLSPNNNWRSFPLSLIESRGRTNAPSAALHWTLRTTGENLALLHRSLKAAFNEYPYEEPFLAADGSFLDVQPLMVSVEKLLAPSKMEELKLPQRRGTSRLPIVNLANAAKSLELPIVPQVDAEILDAR